jgi:hypothetical protein
MVRRHPTTRLRPRPRRRQAHPTPRRNPRPQKALELYVNDRLGAKAIATRLNEQGHCNKGKPYHADSVLNMLRSRTYLGEVYFRGTWYRAENHHEPLVDPDLFEQAQQILIARGDEHAKRAQVNSDYTLAGRLLTAIENGLNEEDAIGRITANRQQATPSCANAATS